MSFKIFSSFIFIFIVCILFLFFVVVTIYATLGEDAIAHGINETEVTIVITTHDLLAKFKNILHKTPKVETLIYMEDQLKKADTSGFKQDIKIIPFQTIIQKGAAANDFGNYILYYYL